MSEYTRWEALEVACVDCGTRFRPWPNRRCPNPDCDTDEGSSGALGRVGGLEAIRARRRWIEAMAIPAEMIGMPRAARIQHLRDEIKRLKATEGG